MISQDQWIWYGSPGHFCCSRDCRFHLTTEIGPYLVSTVGEYFPDGDLRELFASQRGIVLVGRGDARRQNYMEQVGYEDIGYQRKYETMVFWIGENPNRCTATGCHCNLPSLTDGIERWAGGANDAGAATANHMQACGLAARGDIPDRQ